MAKKNIFFSRLRAVSLFSVVRRAKRETREWPRARLMARDGRGSFSSRAAALVSRVSRLRRSRARVHSPYYSGRKRETARSLIFFRTAVLRKFFNIRFSYNHCNFSRVCLLVKIASKTVTRSIRCVRAEAIRFY